MNRIRATLYALGLALAGALAVPAVASATEEPAPVCGTWEIRGATGTYPEIEFGPAPEGSEVVDADTVKLTKAPNGGVEFAAFGLGLELEAETTVSVDYALSADASAALGAVRMFGYTSATPNTVEDAPTWSDTAESAEGTLTFTVPAGATIGTLGLVYDASNPATGSVTFSGMTVGDRPVSFTECETPDPDGSQTPDPDGSQTPDPDGSQTPAPGGSETPAPDGSQTPAPGTSTTPPAAAPSLPVTGPGGFILLGSAVALIGAGLGMYLVARRRKVTFTA